ncbi:hypothetical protein JCM8547_006066 [Rhodosporidiobolus lusitaniae]
MATPLEPAVPSLPVLQVFIETLRPCLPWGFLVDHLLPWGFLVDHLLPYCPPEILRLLRGLDALSMAGNVRWWDFEEL